MMGIETQAVDRENGYLFLFLLVCEYYFSMLVFTKIVVSDLPKLLDMLETLPKYSLV